MTKPTDEEVLIKIQWISDGDRWKAYLLTADEQGHKKRLLEENKGIDLEVTKNRRCIGYISEDGRNPCPDFNSIESGQQCYSCRQKDIHVDYVEGRSGEQRTGQHSVYLAQIGSNVKVGVTRSSRLMRRWIEQGAIYACELKKCEDADTALQIESKLSDEGFKERISKKRKANNDNTDKKMLVNSISEVVNYDIEEDTRKQIGDNEVSEIFDVQSNSIYPNKSDNVKASRYGKINGEVQTVRGQLVFTEDQSWAVTRGLCIEPPSQKSITDF